MEKGPGIPYIQESPRAAGGKMTVGVDVLSKVLFGDRLSTDEKYLEFLKDEQWWRKPIPAINADAPPSYYVEMTPYEREVHQTRIEFTNAGVFKKGKVNPPTLDTLTKYEGWAGLATPETKILYEIPGVRKAMEMYIKMVDDDDFVKLTRVDGTEYSIRTSQNRDEVMNFRSYVREAIAGDIAHEYKLYAATPNFDPKDRIKMKKKGLLKLDTTRGDKKLLQFKCREAEQIACTMLFIGNTFEGLDSIWGTDSRERGPETFSDLVNVPIKLAMNPLDYLVSSFKKGSEELSTVGKFGGWGYNMAVESNGGFPLNNIEEIVIVPAEKGQENRFWTVDRGGRRIFVPECYPRKLVGSVWEETTVEENGVKRTLLSHLRSGEEIPWDKVKGSMWDDYTSKLSKAGKIWDLLQGNTTIRWGQYDEIGKWIQDVTNALAKFGLRNDTSVKRWILYASAGFHEKKRAPRFKYDKQVARKILGDSGTITYLHNNELFFPWDGEGLLAIL
jgi:hypothetical protein